MPRNNGHLTPDEEISSARSVSDELDDERELDVDAEPEPSFHRTERRVPVRRGALPKKAAGRLKIGLLVAVALMVLVAIGAGLYNYGTGSWRFRLDSSDNIEITGTQNVSRAQVMEIIGGDIGRNIFFVSLEDRKKKIEQIPWVESATVMRLLPNHLRVQITERTPVAFVQMGSKIALIDASGVIMEMPPAGQGKYSFPVLVNMAEHDPLSTRAARMKIFSRLVQELGAEGANYVNDLSEIDVSDPDDVKVVVTDPAGAVLLHLGSQNFLSRYKTYMAHAQEWRLRQKLESVDLRYDRQVIVNPDPRATLAPPAPSVTNTTNSESVGHGQAAGKPRLRR